MALRESAESRGGRGEEGETQVEKGRCRLVPRYMKGAGAKTPYSTVGSMLVSHATPQESITLCNDIGGYFSKHSMKKSKQDGACFISVLTQCARMRAERGRGGESAKEGERGCHFRRKAKKSKRHLGSQASWCQGDGPQGIPAQLPRRPCQSPSRGARPQASSAAGGARPRTPCQPRTRAPTARTWG